MQLMMNRIALGVSTKAAAASSGGVGSWIRPPNLGLIICGSYSNRTNHFKVFLSSTLFLAGPQLIYQIISFLDKNNNLRRANFSTAEARKHIVKLSIVTAK
jgi:hypothetical protein